MQIINWFLKLIGARSSCCGAKIYYDKIDIFGDRQRGFCKNCYEIV